MSGPRPPPPPRYRERTPVTTSNDLPGYEITEHVGEVFGVVVRSRGAFPQIGPQLKAIVGGELRTMTNLLERSRAEAIERMVAHAAERGADAVIAMRFDAEAMAEQWSEICAYGTAVKASRKSRPPSAGADLTRSIAKSGEGRIVLPAKGQAEWSPLRAF